MTYTIPPLTDLDRAIMAKYPHRFTSMWAHTDNFESLDQLVNWAKQHIGPDDFAFLSLTFFFKREQDAMLFKLRWL